MILFINLDGNPLLQCLGRTQCIGIFWFIQEAAAILTLLKNGLFSLDDSKSFLGNGWNPPLTSI